jgi:ammonium transporter, Amt family
MPELYLCRYGFNPGSALALLGKSGVASLAAVNTTISAASGTLSALLLLCMLNYRATGQAVWDLLGAANGTLAGLVAITAGCTVVQVCAQLQIAFPVAAKTYVSTSPTT